MVAANACCATHVQRDKAEELKHFQEMQYTCANQN